MSLFLGLPVDSTRNHQAIAFQRYFISNICGKIQYFLRSMQSVHRAHPPGHLQVVTRTYWVQQWSVHRDAISCQISLAVFSATRQGPGNMGDRVWEGRSDGSQLRHKGCSRAYHFPHWIYWWGSVGGSNRVWVGEGGGVRIEVGTYIQYKEKDGNS